jgi:hypothetical protein
MKGQGDKVARNLPRIICLRLTGVTNKRSQVFVLSLSANRIGANDLTDKKTDRDSDLTPSSERGG